MRLGFDHYTVAHRKLSASGCLQFALDHGLEGVQLLEPSIVDPTLCCESMRDLAAEAQSLGLYLEIGIPSPNPFKVTSQPSRSPSARDHARALIPHLEAVSALGCHVARAYLGDRHDRFRGDHDWRMQIAATVDVLRELRPVLLDLGVRVALENHADLTTDELLRVVDEIGSDVLGVTLDTGNLVMRLDDPLRAIERLAPLVLMTHVKDCSLSFTSRGLAWQARPVGAGILPIPDMLAALVAWNPDLNLSIELHPRIYDLPIFDPSWLGFFPALRAADLAGVVRLAHESERRFVDDRMERPETIEAVPWKDRDLDWLARSIGYLRPVVALLTSL
ncbi:MAG TPA: sugar phosphate isomerase/epimerase [Isosphaeraceae bacterium]|nr:sugar phosphate isomerase/epimerase [Isosphaeraceae bacterium]